MHLLDKYIISKRLDVIAFTSFIPVFIISLAIFYFDVFRIGPVPPVTFFLVVGIVIDGAHNYATFFASYFDPQMRERLGLRLILAPLLIFIALLSLLEFTSNLTVYRLIAYSAFFHFVRQEYGWMKLANALDPRPPPWLKLTDLTVIYLITLLPLLWFSKHSLGMFTTVPGDLFHFPDSIVEIAFLFYWAAIVVFVVTNAYFTYIYRSFNLTKWLIFTSVCVVWYLSRVLMFDFYVGMTLYVFCHAIAYYVLVAQRNQATKKIPFVKGSFLRQIVFIYITTVAASWLLSHGIRKNPLAEWLIQGSPFVKSILISIGITPLFMHYYFDAIVWRRLKKTNDKIEVGIRD